MTYRLAHAGRRLMTIGGAAVLTGLALLAAVVGAEMATGQPGLSPVDAYWVGRLPWTPIGVGLVIFGATAAIVTGALAAWLRPGWLARLVGVAAVLAAGFWWGVVSLVGMAGVAGGACCGQPAWDPITAAYSSPMGAVLFLVLPAVVLRLAMRPRREVVELAGPGADQYRTVSGA